MTPEELSASIVAVLRDAVRDGVIGLDESALPTTVTVERPKVREHGDYATNVALQLAKGAGVAPRDLATTLQERLSAIDGIASVDIAGPGFLNIRLEAAAQGALARVVVEAGDAYGSAEGRTRPEGEPRVRLRKPDRAAAPRAHAVGSGR